MTSCGFMQSSHALHGRPLHKHVHINSRSIFKHALKHQQAAVRRPERGAAQVTAAFGLILETDTVLIDLHTDGHRAAFNNGFKALGMECANWTPQVYQEIRRAGDGTALGMVKTYFDTVGWPMMLPDDERKAFAQQVVKQKDIAFAAMLTSGEVPLREGVVKLIDDALADDVKLAALCGTCSTREDKVFSSASFALGISRAQHIISVSPWTEDEADKEEQDAGSSFAAAAADAVAKVKQQEAAALRRSVKNIGVAPDILASTYQLDNSILLRAAKRMGVSPSHCAVLAGTELALRCARSAGMTAISLPTQLSGRYKPPSAQLTFDGFGAGGGAKWDKIKMHLTMKEDQ